MNEFALISQFTAPFGVMQAPFGPGDDAAVLPRTPRSVVTTDTIVEGVHFLRSTFSLADIGHKALAVNLSDLAAMGAQPTWFVCSLQLPPSFTASDLRGLASGMAPLARAHHIALVGGNVTAAPQLSISITAAGTAPRPLLRAGAHAGDLVCVSGPVGNAAAGLQVLQGTHRAGRAQGPLIDAQRRPEPHLAFGRIAARFATAAIDVSDGLAQDLRHLCDASKVSANLVSTALPVSDSLFAWAGSRSAALKLALNGGEDYVVLATMPPTRRRRFERALAQASLHAHFIGTIEPRQIGHSTQVTVDSRPMKKQTGFMHFR